LNLNDSARLAVLSLVVSIRGGHSIRPWVGDLRCTSQYLYLSHSACRSRYGL